jgi:hypothetical protein
MDYLRVGLVIAPQLLAGCLIYLLLLKKSEVNLIELLSMGGVIGIVWSTSFDQIFVNLRLPHIGWLVAVFLAVLTFLQVKRGKKLNLPQVNLGVNFKNSVFAITAIAAMALGTEWFWLFPTGVLMVVASFFSFVAPQKYSRVAIQVANLGAVIAAIYMIAIRPKIWWFMYEHDFPFFQALSRSLADWGLRDYVLLSGTNTRYHWFIYAWIGLVDRTSGASVFFVLTKAAPFTFTLLITAISWSYINRFSKSQFRTFVGTLIVMTASTYPLWGYGSKISFLASPSQFFATSIMFGAFFFLVLGFEQTLRLQILGTSVLVAATILSKTMHGVVVISGIAYLLVAQTVARTKIDKRSFVTGITAIGVGLTTYFLLVSNSEGENVFQIRFGDFFWQLQGDARLLPEKYVDLFGFLTIVSFSVLPILLLLLRSVRFRSEKFAAVDFFSFGAHLSGTLFSILILSAYGENLYFLQAATCLSILIGIAALVPVTFRPISASVIIFLIISGVLLCLLSFAIPSINSGAQDAIIIRSLRVYSGAILLLVISSVLVVISIMRRRGHTDLLLKIFIIGAAMSVSFSAVNWFNTIERKHNEFKRDGLTYFASSDLQSISEWMNSNSKVSEIVASNYGWPKLESSDLEYFKMPCTAFRTKEVSVETCRRTTNGLLVAYMHRRTWLQTTALHYTGFTPEIESRQEITLGFATNPNPKQLEKMLNDGVDWFVVDRSTTNRTNWEPYATIEYTNDSFFALKLKKTN